MKAACKEAAAVDKLMVCHSCRLDFWLQGVLILGLSVHSFTPEQPCTGTCPYGNKAGIWPMLFVCGKTHRVVVATRQGNNNLPQNFIFKVETSLPSCCGTLTSSI